MKIVTKILTLSLLFIFLSAASGCLNKTQESQSLPKMDMLVSAKWLKQHLNDNDLVVIDSTVVTLFDDKGNFNNISGRANYEEGHIPSAVFADLKGNLSNPDSSLEFGMPSPKQFALAMGALGIGDNSRVVIYSDKNEVWATRLWWMLRWAGFNQAAILDGGLKAWAKEGGKLSIEIPKPTVKEFTVSLQKKLVAARDEVFSAITDDNIIIADALSEGHYSGKFSLYSRPGHITSAVNMPSSNYSDSGYYLPFDELDLFFEDKRDRRIITYCGGGIAASSLAFNLTRAGFTDVAVYMGSLEEWTSNSDNPMTVKAR